MTSAAGTFEFPNLPIASYLVMADDRALAAQGYSGKSHAVDLLQSASASITLPIISAQQGATLNGTVKDTTGDPLPLPGFRSRKLGIWESNVPGLGIYTFTDLPNQMLTAIVSAPGYYQIAQVVNATIGYR